ncbi:hypothetical protein CCZ01_06885 [Helicobacter monodelphidis]|uniref:Fic/DOC family protein n=1 Tax=Helicobacter sp. 15-1451 TaxID=2004995 RepID=UPI000DCE94E0|nr:Fic family protein [Helicobacter sp. 15-1451]RAX57183.1 hypothetical protein CCZ01_06885 [Helicobacter sp. 15-1451]
MQDCYSLKESLSLLKEYTLLQEEFNLLRLVIVNHAIDGLYASAQDIREMVDIVRTPSVLQAVITRRLEAFMQNQKLQNYLLILQPLFCAKDNSFTQDLLRTCTFQVSSLIELQQKEKALTLKRELAFRMQPVVADFSYQYLKQIHFALFRDVYHWAGKDRYEMDLLGQFGKGDDVFCMGSLLPKEAVVLFGILKNDDFFKDSNQEEFIRKITFFAADLYALHPFREGNGRVFRIFLSELVEFCGYRLEWSTESTRLISSAFSAAHQGDCQKLENLLKKQLKKEG